MANDMMLQGILDEIEKDGEASVEWVMLQNMSFRSDDKSLPSPSDRLQAWVDENNLKMEQIKIPDGKSKDRRKRVDILKFTRR